MSKARQRREASIRKYRERVAQDQAWSRFKQRIKKVERMHKIKRVIYGGLKEFLKVFGWLLFAFWLGLGFGFGEVSGLTLNVILFGA